MYNSYLDYIEKSKTHNTNFDVSKFTLDVNGVELGFNLPNNYKNLVDAISRIVHEKINLGETTNQTLLTKVNGMLEIPEVLELGEYFAKELSKNLYGTEVFVEHLHTYKNNITSEGEESSWLWHYDNCAPGQIKVMVYLTPTNKENGAFLTLVSPDGFLSIDSTKISPTEIQPPKYPRSRIPISVIEGAKNDGYSEYYIEGDVGTFIVFSQNIAHKATIPQLGPERVCMIYNFRPYHTKLDTHINSKLTNEWDYIGDVKLYNYDL